MSLPEPFQNALVLTGPTASGKSALALALAPRLHAEIISMDSMTLYRGMDIGSAKPTPDERAQVPHHLVDVRDPWESGSVAWWLERAAACVQDIESRGKQALFVGGTPLYLKALLYGIFPSPPADAAIRARLEAEAQEQGVEWLHARLRTIDPITAERLHPNDVRRVVRAIEVWELTGQPISSYQHQWDVAPRPAEVMPRCLCVTVPREQLYERINARVLHMLAAGWMDEVRHLLQLPQPMSKQALQSIGYFELAEVIAGRMLYEDAVNLIQTRTRQLAKRQLTWFRSLPECVPWESHLTSAPWEPKMLKYAVE